MGKNLTYYHLKEGACLSMNDIIELHGVRYKVASGNHGYFMQNVDTILDNDRVFEILGITPAEKWKWAVGFGGGHGQFPKFERLEDLTRFVKAIIETPICSVGDVVEIKQVKHSETNDYPYGIGTVMESYAGRRLTISRIMRSLCNYSRRKEYHGDIHIFCGIEDGGYMWHSSMFSVIQRKSKVKLVMPDMLDPVTKPRCENKKEPQETSPKPLASPQSRQEAPEGCIKINKPQQKFKTKIVL